MNDKKSSKNVLGKGSSYKAVFQIVGCDPFIDHEINYGLDHN